MCNQWNYEIMKLCDKLITCNIKTCVYKFYDNNFVSMWSDDWMVKDLGNDSKS